MLTVVFASGASTRVPYNSAMTVRELLEAVRGDPHASDPAPGRERAYLAAAVNSAALHSPATGASTSASFVTPVPASSSVSSSAPSPPTSADKGTLLLVSPEPPTATFHGAAFVDDKPFPPRQLRPRATLGSERVVSDQHVFVTFIPRLKITDPVLEARNRGSSAPRKSTPCQELSTLFGGIKRDYVVYCDATCGRTGAVYGGADGVYTRDSCLCSAAIHAGVLPALSRGPPMPAYFTVRIGATMPRYLPSLRNEVQTRAYNAPFGSVSVYRYTPGDEDFLVNT